VQIGDREWTVSKVGKECKLESGDDSIWRHSRTIERLLHETKTPVRKPRGRAKLAAVEQS
jgi:hypothetical protein